MGISEKVLRQATRSTVRSVGFLAKMVYSWKSRLWTHPSKSQAFHSHSSRTTKMGFFADLVHVKADAEKNMLRLSLRLSEESLFEYWLRPSDVKPFIDA